MTNLYNLTQEEEQQQTKMREYLTKLAKERKKNDYKLDNHRYYGEFDQLSIRTTSNKSVKY